MVSSMLVRCLRTLPSLLALGLLLGGTPALDPSPYSALRFG
jgi:hypothetical protein